MVTQEIRLGPRELRLLFDLERGGRSAFSFADAEGVLGTSKASVKNILMRLKRKGRIEEIERGRYLLIPARAGYEGTWSEAPLLLVPHLIDTYYVGFWTALNYWGMTEQAPRTVFVATVKRKRDVEYGNARYEFVTLSRGRFFGYAEEEVAGVRVNVSTREKTIVDCLMLPQYCGGIEEAVKGVWRAKEELDFNRLLEYARKVEVTAVLRRLGYIMDLLNVRAGLPFPAFKGFIWLDPLGPKRVIHYSKEYGLKVNRTKEEMLRWMPTA